MRNESKTSGKFKRCKTLHDRRMEVYMYLDMGEDEVVFYMVGEPNETRSIIMHNEEAVISPSCSSIVALVQKHIHLSGQSVEKIRNLLIWIISQQEILSKNIRGFLKNKSEDFLKLFLWNHNIKRAFVSS